MEKIRNRDVIILFAVIGWSLTSFFALAGIAFLDIPVCSAFMFLTAVVACPLIKKIPIQIYFWMRCLSGVIFFIIALILVPIDEDEEIFAENNMTQEIDAQTSVFTVEDYDIQLVTPYGWEEVESDNFDIQCISPKKDMYMSVFGYWDMDLGQDQTVQEFFEYQNELLLEDRNNVREIELVISAEEEDKIIYEMLYSAELDGSKNYYDMFMVEFKNADNFAWILVTGLPSTIEKNREEIKSIISDIKSIDANIL